MTIETFFSNMSSTALNENENFLSEDFEVLLEDIRNSKTKEKNLKKNMPKLYKEIEIRKKMIKNCCKSYKKQEFNQENFSAMVNSMKGIMDEGIENIKSNFSLFIPSNFKRNIKIKMEAKGKETSNDKLQKASYIFIATVFCEILIRSVLLLLIKSQTLVSTIDSYVVVPILNEISFLTSISLKCNDEYVIVRASNDFVQCIVVGSVLSKKGFVHTFLANILITALSMAKSFVNNKVMKYFQDLSKKKKNKGFIAIGITITTLNEVLFNTLSTLGLKHVANQEKKSKL